jgi:hypothetical protein
VPDTKLSDPLIPTLTTPTDLDELYVNDDGVSKKITLQTLTTYFEQRARQNNASVAAQSGFAVDTYVTGSDVAIPAGRLQAKTMYRCRFNVTKTAAGTAQPILYVRVGTGATTTTDVSRGTMMFAAQTAVADEGLFEVFSTFRTVGAGTSATLQSLARLSHRLAATGLSVANAEPKTVASGGFDSTVANLRIGVSVNGGASAAWTVNLVQAELFNLA